MKNKTDSDYLQKIINNLIILFSYSDTSRVGRDDYDNDYLTILNVTDEYIKACLVKALDDKFGRRYCNVFMESSVNCGYYLGCQISENMLPCARWPRAAYYFDPHELTITQGWLFDSIIKFYDAEKHRNVSQYYGKTLKSRLSKLTVDRFKVEYSGFHASVEGLVLDDDSRNVEFEYSFDITNNKNGREIFNLLDYDCEYKICKELILCKHLRKKYPEKASTRKKLLRML